MGNKKNNHLVSHLELREDKIKSIKNAKSYINRIKTG